MAIKDETLGIDRCRQVNTLNRSRFESNIGIAVLQHHHGPDGVGKRNACQEADDVDVVPDPATLELRQLILAGFDGLQDVLERFLVAGEGGHFIHRFISYFRVQRRTNSGLHSVFCSNRRLISSSKASFCRSMSRLPAS